jgi:hypothetical protein
MVVAAHRLERSVDVMSQRCGGRGAPLTHLLETQRAAPLLIQLKAHREPTIGEDYGYHEETASKG